MDTNFDGPTVAGALVVFTGALHLVLAALGITDGIGVLPVLFAIWGLLAIAGVVATARGRITPQAAYTGGILLFAVSLVGYAEVHAFGTLESAFGIDWGAESVSGHEHGHDDHGHDGHGHDDHGHNDGVVETLVDHLATDPVALLSKTAEAAGIGILGFLRLKE